MSFDVLGDLNWLAVIVAGVIYWALGALWYMALFGDAWMRSVGMDAAQAEQERMGAGGYAVPLVSYLVLAVAVGMLARATGSDTFAEGLILGLVLGIGLAVVLIAVTAVFDPQKADKGAWFYITAGYHLVGVVLTAIIVSVWI